MLNNFFLNIEASREKKLIKIISHHRNNINCWKLQKKTELRIHKNTDDSPTSMICNKHNQFDSARLCGLNLLFGLIHTEKSQHLEH
jgi:hypothetical protein